MKNYQKFFNHTVIISLIVCVSILISCGSDSSGVDSSSIDDMYNYISSDADSFFVIDFQAILETKYDFTNQPGERGEYFRYLSNSLSFSYQKDLHKILVVELDRSDLQFGIDGDMFNAKADSYYILFGNFDEYKFQTEKMNKPDSLYKEYQFNNRLLYKIPVKDLPGKHFLMTYYGQDIMILASNENSMKSVLDLFFGDKPPLEEKDLIIKRHKAHMAKSFTYTGIFRWNGEILPDKVIKRIKGLDGVNAIGLQATYDNRIILLSLHFFLNRKKNPSTLVESFKEYFWDTRESIEDIAIKQLFGQSSFTTLDNRVIISFNMTHEHMGLFESLITRLIKKDFVE